MRAHGRAAPGRAHRRGIAYVVTVSRVPVILRLLTLNAIQVRSRLHEMGSFPTAEGAQVAVDLIENGTSRWQRWQMNLTVFPVSVRGGGTS